MRWFMLMTMMTGCAMSVHGTLAPVDNHMTVRAISGEQTRLALRGEAAVIEFMGGELVQLDGTRAWGRLRVKEWRILEGASGLPAYVGRLRVVGTQLVLQDHFSGAVFALADTVTQELRPFVGQPVMVEGYIDPTYRLEVMHFRVLVEGEQ